MIKKIYQKYEVFFRYVVVGGFVTLLDLFLFTLFLEYFGVNVVISAVFAFLCANITSFVLNRSWTFRVSSTNYRKLYIKFLSVSLMGLIWTILFVYFFVEILMIWPVASKLLTSAIVMFWNFLANKLWTFRVRRKEVVLSNEYQYLLSVVVPAYNEGNRIVDSLKKISDFLEKQDFNYEIIVVSDGSTDDTNQIVLEMMKEIENLKFETYQKNQGKGYAVGLGVLQAQGQYILFTDADNSTPIEEFEVLFSEMQERKADIAIGSRYLKESKVKVKQPKYRIMIGRMGNFLIQNFLLDGVVDTQCGFKLMKNHVGKEVFSFQKVKRFGFDMEMLVVAKNLGYKVVEVPVSWFNSAESRVRPFKDSFITLRDLFYIKLNLWSGRYSEKELDRKEK